MSQPSYEKINYQLRSAKGAERKMIVETISRLRPLSALEAYRYVGFGSPYFSDFSLVHRALGMSDMICIEREEQDALRFEFNRPFNCIDLRFGHSSQVLAALEWAERPTVVWLDYDDPINEAILTDVGVVCSSIAGGSFFLVTVKNRAKDFGEKISERVQQFTEAVGGRFLIHDRSEVTDNGFPGLLWRVISSEIERVISDRSAVLPNALAFEYQQVLHIDYRDGVRMLTIGGTIFQRGQRSLLAQCDFGSLAYSRTGKESCRIRAPLLTYKELRALDEHLPGDTPSLPGVPQREVNAYVDHYRYFPNFVDAAET